MFFKRVPKERVASRELLLDVHCYWFFLPSSRQRFRRENFFFSKQLVLLARRVVQRKVPQRRLPPRCEHVRGRLRERGRRRFLFDDCPPFSPKRSFLLPRAHHLFRIQTSSQPNLVHAFRLSQSHHAFEYREIQKRPQKQRERARSFCFASFRLHAKNRRRDDDQDDDHDHDVELERVRVRRPPSIR